MNQQTRAPSRAPHRPARPPLAVAFDPYFAPSKSFDDALFNTRPEALSATNATVEQAPDQQDRPGARA